jgi:hypothetical protein
MLLVGVGNILNSAANPQDPYLGDDPVEILLGGAAVILGALAYRSAKKRLLGQVKSTLARQFIESALVMLSVAIIVTRPNLKYHIATHPLIHVGIPVWVIIAYLGVLVMMFASPPEENRV